MKKPVIGVAPLYDAKARNVWMIGEYFEAIEAAGGIPVMLSIHNGLQETGQILEAVDGVLLPGGEDIHPMYYGEDMSEHCNVVKPERDISEISLVKEAHRRGVPLFGICKGCQTINVALGGSLYQDIAAQCTRDVRIIHSQTNLVPNEYPIHRITISKDSRLYECFGRTDIYVNSLHHQAGKAIADGLFASARADDRIVEAVECVSKGQFVLGVQWHPELMFKQSEDALKLFKYYISCTALYL